MSYNQSNMQDKDPQLWKIAQARASFQSHFRIYLVMCLFFWVLWFFTGRNDGINEWPWPVWPMVGWGIGVAFHYIGAYVTPQNDPAEREYQKLVQQKNKQQNL